jgi:hypothetical protein
VLFSSGSCTVETEELEEVQMKTSRRSGHVLAMPPVEAAGTTSTSTDVSQDHVAQRAFELYCARGCEDGHDLDDWLQAEREVRGRATSSAA